MAENTKPRRTLQEIALYLTGEQPFPAGFHPSEETRSVLDDLQAHANVLEAEDLLAVAAGLEKNAARRGYSGAEDRHEAFLLRERAAKLLQ